MSAEVLRKTASEHEYGAVAPQAAVHSSEPRSSRSSGAAIVSQVAQLVRERDELARRVTILDAKLIEVTDRSREGEAAVREAYRRGYFAGRAAKRRGAAEVADPERHARGWVREVLAA